MNEPTNDITMGIIGTIIDALIVKRLIERQLPDIAMRPKHHIEIGEQPTKYTTLSG